MTVAFNLRGNEYNGKYYVNLQGWKIGHNDGTEVILEEVREQTVPQQIEKGSDDLPF